MEFESKLDYSLIANETVRLPRDCDDLERTKVTMKLTAEGAEWGPRRPDAMFWTGTGFAKVHC